MNECPYTRQISAYHDGELAPAVRQQVEVHLRECLPCRAELEALRTMSALFVPARAETRGLSQIGRERIKSSYRRDKSVLWLVEAVSGLAAALLIGGSLWLATHPTQPRPTNDMASLNAWVMQTGNELPSDHQTQLAGWIVTDLSREAE